MRKWTQDGTWLKIHNCLRDYVRTMEGHLTAASAGVLDSQSVKTATMINQEVGYDAGKRIKGRKRFTLVDTFGLLIAVKVVFCQRFSILLRTFLF
ncbi:MULTISPECIES: transposase [Microcystis]|uniref:Transposase IS4-like domain-containing protein n=5 Tax=Microcystis TaxID=1125 RepID=A0A841UT32_MICAE|nr:MULTISPECIES: transposase [Microcystis]MBC1192074.1 hypothetical protein [Microcystis aeruginosa BLCC-F108]MCA2590967.1 hypothetical protein [Microcystis sp. M31BS1]MDB9408110.1 hypothetical protein [Microcystis aeruginosa CS-558/01A06]